MNKSKYVFIGDSLTYGYGVMKNDNWVMKVQQALGTKIINKGTNGDTTANMLNRFTEDVIDNNPSLTFIMGGTNDLLSNRTINSIIRNIELMIKDCISINSKVVVGIPPTILGSDAYKLFSPSPTYDYCETQLPLLKDRLIDLCSFYKIPYIDFYTLSFENLCNDIFSDGIHLNIKGQELLCSEALRVLNTL